MSAGTGVVHSEHNWGQDLLRFFQIWIFLDKKGHKPNYGDYRFGWSARIDNWLPLATGLDTDKSEGSIKMHADVNVYANYLTEGRTSEFKVAPGRQAYLVVMEGAAEVGEIKLGQRDALEIVEENISITAKDSAHMLVIEMAKN